MNYSQRSNSVNFTIIGFITNHLVYHSLKKLNSKKLGTHVRIKDFKIKKKKRRPKINK